MAFAWPDPPAPIRDEHGQIPPWLQLGARTEWQGNDWHCSLCGMWADAGHLGGHKHRNRLAQIAAVEAPVRDAAGRVPDWLVIRIGLTPVVVRGSATCAVRLLKFPIWRVGSICLR